MTAIVWFRQDLRLADHPALFQACRSGQAVIPVYIWNPDVDWAPGAASRWWLHHSLDSLQQRLREMGSDLILRQGDPVDVLQALQHETGATALYAHRQVEPAERTIEAGLEKAGVFEPLALLEVEDSQLLFSPKRVLTGQGTGYRVFRSFYKNCLSQDGPREPLPVPTVISPPAQWPANLELKDLNLLPPIDWADGIRQTWTTGEVAAQAQLEHFLETALRHYEKGRDYPAEPLTSRLSPYLCFGEISPHQVWRRVQDALADQQARPVEGHAFLRELLFREYAHHLLYHCPSLPDQSMDARFARLEWEDDAEMLAAWRHGKTGYPIVDAGMRQLRQTGWMHNRVRMIVGSFLVKDLLQPWQQGERWFWDTLIDANLANNAFNWQWVAGCGADASPFFRIFNPVRQGEKFDPEGHYVRTWLPELAALPNRWIHQPDRAPEAVLRTAGVTLGATYPLPVVQHDRARDRALGRYRQMRGQTAGLATD